MNAISRLVIDTDCCCVFLYGTCKIINQVSQCRHRYVSWSLSTSPSPARIFYSYFIDFFAFVRVFSAICCCCSYLTLVCFLPTREKRSKKKKNETDIEWKRIFIACIWSKHWKHSAMRLNLCLCVVFTHFTQTCFPNENYKSHRKSSHTGSHH